MGIAGAQIRPYKALGVLLVSVALFGCQSTQSAFVAACEKVIKERLKAPSSYKQIDVSFYNELLDRDNYASWLAKSSNSDALNTLMINDFDDGKVEAHKLTAYISYDANNSYNAPIRGKSECTFTYDGDPNFEVFSSDIYVDGYNEIGWLTKQLKRSD